ncbi:GntR family transcriptional regulator [Nocardia sp. alder85J]|uniref:GntR family transcriptional regulator n=1 Tax=Nocardia sp. alder85J TaxID=2862949 RepID=UPI001CD6EB11|nr:GntR family transcriptional regulator [Nocardia sp. alder85J]MCX4095933.1 GntR family transcriptional regulator [Nocardia sp. alder85J]
MKSPRYLEIADQLAAELADCRPGTRVASEHDISVRFGVGRAASRSALQELERRLVVRRVQGAGTFVNRRIDYVIAQDRQPSFTATVRAAGATPRVQVRVTERMPLPADLAPLLELPPGAPIHHVIRVGFIDDVPSGWSQEWIPVEVTADLGPALRATESLELVLRQLGRVQPVRSWCRVGLDVPPPEVPVGLGTDHGIPLWHIESLSRDADTTRPLLYSETWHRTDCLRVVVELGAPGAPPHP